MSNVDKRPATSIRKSNVVMYQNVPHIVTEVEHRTQGRQAGFIQVTLRNLATGIATQNKFHSNDTVFFCYVESKELEYSYEDNEGYHFLHPDTYEDEVIPSKLLEDQKSYLIQGESYSVLFVDDRPLQIQLPASVAMKVIEASEGVRGDTATNAQKTVVVETGMKVQVPLFIKTGETIRIDTDKGTYLGRA